VFTSLFSKAATLSINFLALPLLFRYLGPKEFSLYAALNAAAAWLAYANLGIGPRLVTATAAAFSEHNKDRIPQLISSVIYPVSMIASALAVTLLSYVLFGRPEIVLGSNFAGHQNLVRATGAVLISTAWFQVIASVYEAVQTGYHEQGIQNLLFGIGNVVSFIALISLIRIHPTVTGAICCLTVPIALARAVNILCLRKRHPEIRSEFVSLNWRLSSHMLGSGLAFSMISIGSFLNHQLPILLVNHITLELTSTMATLLNLVMLATGLVTMITIPMCASIADSVASHDFDWIRGFLRKLILGTLVYALIVGLVLCTVGSKVLMLAFGNQLFVETATLVLVSGYLLLVLLEHVLVMTLIALGKIWQSATLYLLRGTVAVVIVPAATRLAGVNGVFIVLITLVILITIPCYYLLLRFAFRDLHRTTATVQTSQLLEAVPSCS
jgi:O-antigen/teichoic acid export membrane protein